MNEPDQGILYRLKKDKYVIRKKEHSLNFSIESGNSYLFTDENNFNKLKNHKSLSKYNINNEKDSQILDSSTNTSTCHTNNKINFNNLYIKDSEDDHGKESNNKISISKTYLFK